MRCECGKAHTQPSLTANSSNLHGALLDQVKAESQALRSHQQRWMQLSYMPVMFDWQKRGEETQKE